MRAALRVLALLAALTAAAPALADGPLSPPEALARTQAHTVTLVDVRTPQEWRDTGIPAGATTVSWGRADFVDAMLNVVHGDRNAPLVLICRSGNRSGRAVAALRENGFSRVVDVAEGMSGSSAGPGWLARGLPVEPWRPN